MLTERAGEQKNGVWRNKARKALETLRIYSQLMKMFPVVTHICSGLYLSVHVFWEDRKACVCETKRERESKRQNKCFVWTVFACKGTIVCKYKKKQHRHCIVKEKGAREGPSKQERNRWKSLRHQVPTYVKFTIKRILHRYGLNGCCVRMKLLF